MLQTWLLIHYLMTCAKMNALVLRIKSKHRFWYAISSILMLTNFSSKVKFSEQYDENDQKHNLVNIHCKKFYIMLYPLKDFRDIVDIQPFLNE